MSSAGNGQRYRIIISFDAQKHVKQFHLQASVTGKSGDFMKALRKIGERLQQDPLNFGEPIFTLFSLCTFAKVPYFRWLWNTAFTPTNRSCSFVISNSSRKILL